MELNFTNLAIVRAYDAGWRVINGILYTPNGEVRDPSSQNMNYRKFTFFPKPRINNQRKINVRIHRLVAFQKFGYKIFEKDIDVRHLDGNSHNNHEDNIDIGTRIQNIRDKTKEVMLRGAKQACIKNRKFSDEQIENFIKLIT